MRARIWGCRGSLAAPGPETLRYGGNTSCIEVRLADGTLLILDAGTGIRPLGLTLGPGQIAGPVHVFLSHLHLDHLQGLAFFGPLWRPEVELHVWGPQSPTRSLRRRVMQYLSPPLFPVPLDEIPSNLLFHDLPRVDIEIGDAVVRARPVSHQGPTVGYRIEENGKVLAYIPDHEPALGIDLARVAPEWISGHAVAREADVLLHDAQYTEEEYPHHVGWGHSSVEHVVRFARVAGADRLLMFHHDPLHSDADLEVMRDRAAELTNGSAPELAYEGMELTFG